MVSYGKRFLVPLVLVACGCRTISIEEFEALQRINRTLLYARRDYVVQPGDTARVTVWRGGTVAREFAQDITVQPDGKITLVNIERPIDTTNLTVDELQNRIQEAYYSLFVADQGPAGYKLTVQLLTSQKTQWIPDQVYVTGQVKRPTPLAYRRGMTALRAIAEAGHWLFTADESRIVILRSNPEGKTVTREINLEGVVEHSGDDPELFPGDVVFVPLSFIAKVNLFVELYIRNNLPISPGLLRGFFVAG